MPGELAHAAMAAGRTLHNAYLLAPGLLHRVRQRRALHHAEAHLQHFLLQMLASQHARGLWYVAAHGFVAADESFLRQSSTTLLPRSIEPLVWASSPSRNPCADSALALMYLPLRSTPPCSGSA